MSKFSNKPNVTPEEYRNRYKTIKTNERRAKIRASKLKAIIKLIWPMFKHIEDYETLTGKKITIIEEENK